MADVYESSFKSELKRLERNINNQTMWGKCNNDKELNLIVQYSYLFYDYYRAVSALLDNDLSSATFPITRSAAECFASVYSLISSYQTASFKQAMNALLLDNAYQLFQLYKNITDSAEQQKILDRINKILLATGSGSGSLSVSDCKKILNKDHSSRSIQKLVQDAFSSVPEYAADLSSVKTLYVELCVYAHNDSDSIIQRYYDNKDGVLLFNPRKEDENINPSMHLFVSCARYISGWIEKRDN